MALSCEFERCIALQNNSLFLVYNQCGVTHIVLDSNSATITTPYFPSNYPHNSNCTWIIKSPKKQTMLIYFQEFDLEKCCDCVEVNICK